MEVKMKKYNLFKILMIILVVLGVMSWIIPAGSFSEGVYTAVGTLPMGLFDFFRIPLLNFNNYLVFGVYFLVLGGFYGILNKTGVYASLVDFFANNFSKKEHTMLILTALFLGILSAFTALTFVLFIYVPFFIAVLLEMKYSKKTALLATVGAIIAGNFASIYGFNVSGYINYFFQLDVNNSVYLKLILFIMTMSLLIVYLIKTGKDKQEEKHLDIPLYEDKKDKNKSFVPLVILLDVVFFFLLVASFNWKYGFKFELFNTLHTDMQGFKLFGTPILSNILGGVNPLGTWGIVETIIIMFMLMTVIAWLYSVKFDEAVKGFIDGAKEMIVPAFYAVMSYIVVSFLSTTSNGGGTIYNTLTDGILSIKDGFSYFATIFTSILGGLFHSDFSNLVYSNAEAVTAAVTDVNKYPVIGMAYQTIHAVFMLVMPTSVFLVAGLSYLKISFIDWIKYIWKFALQLFGLALILITLMTYVTGALASSLVILMYILLLAFMLFYAWKAYQKSERKGWEFIISFLQLPLQLLGLALILITLVTYIDSALASGFAILIYVLLALLIVVANWKIYQKAGRKGWESIVPVYNYIVLFEIVKLPVWQAILLFIPFVNIYIVVKLTMKLSEVFGKSQGFALGLFFFPIVFYPMLAFDDSKYKK
jgi:uncharacterized ion transporter superfamily protein YfcC